MDSKIKSELSWTHGTTVVTAVLIGSKSGKESESFCPGRNSAEGGFTMVFTGIIGTSDLFVSNTEKARWIFTEFGAIATEMEGAAVGHVCRSIGLPFIVLRSCSDNANNQAQLNFSQFVGPAASNSSQLVLGMLQEIRK